MKVSEFVAKVASGSPVQISRLRQFEPWGSSVDYDLKRAFIVEPSVQRHLDTLIHQPGCEKQLSERGAYISSYAAKALAFCWFEDVLFCVRSQAIFLEDGRGIEETLKFKGANRSPVELERPAERMAPWARRMLPQQIERLDEAVVRVANDAWTSYGHWHLQVLPAIDFLKGIGLLNEVRLALPKLKRWQLESLDYFGIPRERVLELPTGVYSCRRILYVSVPDRHLEMFFHPKQLMLYERFCQRRAPLDKLQRVYLSRLDASRRRLDTELELIELLRTLGFRSYAPALLTYEQQIELATHASCIVAPHGSALTNALFAPKGTPICELHTLGALPRDHAFHFRMAASLRQQPYAAYFSADHYRHPDTRELRWRVDAGHCARFVNELLQRFDGS
jgi:capsular polysaccharide biosynthesis protein